jgi:hypothetical protein
MSKIKEILESDATKLRRKDDLDEIMKQLDGYFEDVTFVLETMSDMKVVPDNIKRKILKVRRDILKIQSEMLKERKNG